jgi:hypothetical protein
MKRELADGLHVLTAYTSVLQRLPYASVTSLIPAQGQALLCNHARIADFKQKKIVNDATTCRSRPDTVQRVCTEATILDPFYMRIVVCTQP